MENNTMVSIICNAYNHENYIRDAIEGFLMQETAFNYEILIHDDASTDNTANIIREYEQKYPALIKPIYQFENQFSINRENILKLQYGRVKGKYIAICEGDDYWTDAKKLQKQFDLMEKNPNINMCAHNTAVVHAETKEILYYKNSLEKSGIIPPDQVIVVGGGVVSTNSIFFRQSLLNNLSRFITNMFYDYSLLMFGSMPNGILYVDDCMSSYRRFSKDSFTSRMRVDLDSFFRYKNRVIEMLKAFNEDTDYKYSASVEKAILREEYNILAMQNDYKAMVIHPYYKELNFKSKMSPIFKRILKVFNR